MKRQKKSCLCADIGTTSLKAAIINEDGCVLSSSRVWFSGGKRLGEEWKRALKEAISSMKNEISSVSLVSISGNGPTIVGENGEVLLWKEKIEGESSGSPSFFIPRIKEFIKRNSGKMKKGALLFSPAEYLSYYLTGKKACCIPNEKYLPYYWTLEELKKEGIPPETLPPFLLITDFIGEVTEDAALETKIPQGSRVVSSSSDFIAAMIGTSSLYEGSIFHRAGSSEGFNLAVSSKINEKDLRLLPSCTEGLWNLGIVNDEGASSFEEYKRETEKNEGRKISYTQIIEMALFDKESEASRILRKILQSEKKALLRLLEIREKNVKTPLKEIIVTGGQAKNEKWMQMKASFLGVKLSVMNLEDAELLGGAAVAFTASGVYGSLREASLAVSHETLFYFPEEKKQRPSEIYKIPEKLKAVCFDIDSTLYSNEAYEIEQLDVQIREFARTRGMKENEARNKVALFRYNHFKKTGEKLSLANTLLHFGVSIEESVKMRRELLEPALFLERDEKLKEALLYLSSRFTLFAVTNNPEKPARKTLEALGVENFFSTLVALDTFFVSKPDAKPFLYACEKENVKPEEVLSIGDRYDIDIKTPLQIGMGALLVHSVENVYSLPYLFERSGRCR